MRKLEVPGPFLDVANNQGWGERPGEKQTDIQETQSDTCQGTQKR